LASRDITKGERGLVITIFDFNVCCYSRYRYRM